MASGNRQGVNRLPLRGPRHQTPPAPRALSASVGCRTGLQRVFHIRTVSSQNSLDSRALWFGISCNDESLGQSFFQSSLKHFQISDFVLCHFMAGRGAKAFNEEKPSPILLSPGTDFVEDNFSTDWEGGGDGFWMIHAHYVRVHYISSLMSPQI